MVITIDSSIAFFFLTESLCNNFLKSQNFQLREEGQSLDSHSHLMWKKWQNHN